MTVEEKIIDYITKYCRGHQAAASAPTIEAALKGVGFSVTAYEIQRMIGDIRREKKALIGSDGSGYFLIINEQDLARTLAWVKSRIGPIVQAAQALDEMWGEQHGQRYSGDLFNGVA